VDTDPFKVIRYHSVPVPKRPPYRFGVPLLDWGYMTEQHQMYPDLVHAHSPFLAGREALRIAKSRNIPLVASFHSKYYDDILQVTNSRFLSVRQLI
jgi:glycosyltransferase involved in cell wall biosynthesis